MANTKKEVATTGGLPFLAVADEKAGLPAHINADDNRGSENVSSADLTLPRLRLVQYISDELKKNSDSYIEGIEAGQLVNSVSKAVSDKLYVLPVYYERKFNVWRSRDAGGGLIASCFSETEAREELAKACEAERISLDDEDRVNRTFDLIDTPTHYCLEINPETGETSPIIIDMPSTKQKVSRTWNTNARQKAGASFAHVWALSTVEETNRRKEDYFNYKVEYVGFATKELYDRGEASYAEFAASVGKPAAETGATEEA